MPDINIYQVLNEIEPSKQIGIGKSKISTPNYSYTPSFTEQRVSETKNFNFEPYTPIVSSYTPSYTYTPSTYEP